MSESAQTLLIRKLDSLAALTQAERDALHTLPIQTRDYPAKVDIVTEGEVPTQCCLVVEGAMFRYKVLPSGQRQIVNLHIVGDVPDLQSLHLSVMDHHLAALTPVTAGLIPHAALRDLNARFPRVAGALWRVTLIDASLLRERIASLGQRSAVNRLAHLLCETFTRLDVMGRTRNGTMFIPITQVEMADMLGLSAVHMNRTVQDLRGRGLVVIDRDRITLPDFGRLAELAGFDPLYLHLDPYDRPQTP